MGEINLNYINQTEYFQLRQQYNYLNQTRPPKTFKKFAQEQLSKKYATPKSTKGGKDIH